MNREIWQSVLHSEKGRVTVIVRRKNAEPRAADHGVVFSVVYEVVKQQENLLHKRSFYVLFTYAFYNVPSD